jgi:hypothetical protein
LTGKRCWRGNGDAADAALEFHAALALAQGAKLWELRAATTLARLSRDANKVGAARDTLAGVYPSLIEASRSLISNRQKRYLAERPVSRISGRLVGGILCVGGSAGGGGDGVRQHRRQICPLLGEWQPKIVAELNDQELKLLKDAGTFPWHHHDDAEEGRHWGAVTGDCS